MSLAKDEFVTLAHGSGGEASHELISRVAAFYETKALAEMGDAALLNLSAYGEHQASALTGERAAEAGDNRPAGFAMAMTTDSFVVDPIFFPGGDIGKLSICGTVNDLLMRGSCPAYLTLGMVIEEGLPFADLEAVARSIGATAAAAGVQVVAGDTKVVEGHKEGGGLLLNTAGVGFFPAPYRPVPVAALKPGDVIILSGTLGDHHAVIMSQRLGIKNDLVSDVSCLGDIVFALQQEQVDLHAMRDVTRGGLATVLNELAGAAAVDIVLEEQQIPLHPTVRGLCDLLGLDPLEMGNEGKMLLVVPADHEQLALAAVRSTQNGKNAAVIGRVEPAGSRAASVRLQTVIGTERLVMPLIGEGLPRIC